MTHCCRAVVEVQVTWCSEVLVLLLLLLPDPSACPRVASWSLELPCAIFFPRYFTIVKGVSSLQMVF